eukprot:TRINITY_DN38654_c0_g1_i1.p1 TRINITY_DN38654_c0_g1~~TRINITY_DN38654_c0_g1_i1.p1  ORF type:complete len:146 (-),score=20.16 TRINITY_DN38654_c0_g1_i1:150-587(-)
MLSRYLLDAKGIVAYSKSYMRALVLKEYLLLRQCSEGCLSTCLVIFRFGQTILLFFTFLQSSSSDYDGTVACIWRFLHGSDDRVDSFTSLMMESKEFAHWRSRGDTIKFSDLLLSKGVDDFAKAHWSLNAVLSRQAAIYGCPQPN